MATFTLITNCSSTRTVEPKVRVGDMPAGQTMASALNWWMAGLALHDADITPRELYRGMGFMTIAKIEQQYSPTALKIITGGQGFTDADEKIVPYDFTANKNEAENIYQAVTAEPFVAPVWWRMINQARHNTQTPIADYVQQSSDELILIACGKVFVRYIAEDLLSLPYDQRSRVRVLLSASSVGSVPAQLRPMLIPYDRSIITHLPGNRNDANHRAAQFFLNLWHTDDEFRAGTVESQRKHFIGTSHASPRAQIDIVELLRSRPELLAMDCEQAYRVIQREIGTFGGKMAFRSAYRQVKGVEIEVDEAEVTAAVDSMQGLAFLTNIVSAQASTSEEDLVLSSIRTFIEALKQVAPNAPFTAANISEWARSHYKDAMVTAMGQPNKLAYILKNNYSLLGLVELDAAGAKSYTIRQQA